MNPLHFHIKSSSSLSDLALEFVHDTKSHKSNLFHPLQIVTQTEGMNNWLTEKITSENGIAANIEFLKLNDLLYRIYLALGGMYQKSLSAETLSWVLYDLLGDNTVKDKFPSLKNYYFNGEKEDKIKRIELARKISDLFDQYQAYRPELLSYWNQDKLYYKNENEEFWQKELWCLAKEKAGRSFPDRLAMKLFIQEKFQNPKAIENLHEKVPAVYIFGTVLLTELHQELLTLISTQIPVFIYLPNPAPEIYWYEDFSKKELFYKKLKGKDIPEDVEANPLLLNWGKLIQNTFMLLFQNDEIINLYKSTGNQTFGKDTLLHSLQHLISNNTVPESDDFFTDTLLKDGSLTINSCHSPIREIQSLYNYLVRLTDVHSGKLNARDIVVQVTDIDKYASYIRAVFDNAPYQFPYRITDENMIASDTLNKALAEILLMDATHFTSESVMQLLDFSSIRSHFGIYNTDAIRDIVNEANIRHGINGNPKDETQYVSWAYGLKRIMYGICISGGEETGSDGNGFFPLDVVEGTDAEEVIHFTWFIDTLIRIISEREHERTIKGWIEYTFDLIQSILFNEEEQDNEEYRQLISTIEKMADGEELISGKIPYGVFIKQLLPAIGNTSREYRFVSGGITFCSTIPMRSIPFRIVALLGLDFDKFPRKNNPAGFDLMFKYPRKGDRSLKMNDKHLFLETVMSAGDYLYLSYNGQDIQTNASKPPSILIDELLSFISEYSRETKSLEKLLITQQSLHLFGSPKKANTNYYNYLLTNPDKVNIRSAQPTTNPGSDKINIRDLVSFFKNSIKWYYQKGLKMFLEKEDVALSETELFDLNSLEQWSLKNELLLTDNIQLESIRSRMVKTGKLPFENYGRLILQDLNEQIQPTKEKFMELGGGRDSTQESILITLENISILGELPMVFGDRILIPCLSKNKNNYLFRAYIYALLSSVSKKTKEIVVISDQVYTAHQISSDRAEALLKTLLKYFVAGSNKIIPFFADISLDKEEVKAMEHKKFLQFFEKKSGSGGDEYFLREYNAGYFDNVNNFEEYKKVADDILTGYKEVFD